MEVHCSKPYILKGKIFWFCFLFYSHSFCCTRFISFCSSPGVISLICARKNTEVSCIWMWKVNFTVDEKSRNQSQIRLGFFASCCYSAVKLSIGCKLKAKGQCCSTEHILDIWPDKQKDKTRYCK